MTRSDAWPKQKKETATPKMAHRLLDAMSRQRKYQLRHKRAGLCCYCSRPVASGTLFCELHRRTRNVKNREWQRKRFRRKLRYPKAESYRFTGSNAYGRKARSGLLTRTATTESALLSMPTNSWSAFVGLESISRESLRFSKVE
jgi:hypothetical protein